MTKKEDFNKKDNTVMENFSASLRRPDAVDCDLIYVIGSEDTGVPFKIGKSNEKSLKNRIKSLQTGNPNSLKIFYQYQSKKINSLQLEKIIRDRLIKNYGFTKLRGEWITTNAKKPIDKIGVCIKAILKDCEYKPEDDPNYHALIEQTYLQHKKYMKALNKYNKKADKFVHFISEYLFERQNLNEMAKDLENKTKKLSTYKINETKPFDWKFESNYNNFLEWLYLFYKMYNKRIRYTGMNQQNFNYKFEISSFFGRNIIMYMSKENDGIATTKFTLNTDDDEIVAETPYRDESLCTLRWGKENIRIGKCFLDDTTLYRRYSMNDNNVDLYDTINFNLPKEFTYHPKEINIIYNNKKSKTYILNE